MEALSTILKVAQQIAKAAKTASRNKTRCGDLADRVSTVGDILRESSSSSNSKGVDTATRTRALGRLADALADALKLVDACSSRRSWFARLLASGSEAKKFRDVDARINSCVVDLGFANDARLQKLFINELAARHRRPRVNAGSGKKEMNKTAKKKDGAKKNGNKSKEEMNRNSGTKKKDVGNSKNKTGSTGGKKGGAQNGRKQMRGKAPPPPQQPRRTAPFPTAGSNGQRYVVHSMEDDPTACSVM